MTLSCHHLRVGTRLAPGCPQGRKTCLPSAMLKHDDRRVLRERKLEFQLNMIENGSNVCNEACNACIVCAGAPMLNFDPLASNSSCTPLHRIKSVIDVALYQVNWPFLVFTGMIPT